MTLADILKANGVTDDGVEAIIKTMKENKLFTASEENLDIRYGKLKTDHAGVSKQLQEANALIEELKKSTDGQAGLQDKITQYEAQIGQLQAELQQTKLDAEIRVGLLAANALDVDYVAYKLREKGDLKLDENGKIAGWKDKLDALKVQLPTQFSGATTNKVLENKLPDTDHSENTVSKEAFGKMSYAERLKLYQENPDAYNQLNK